MKARLILAFAPPPGVLAAAHKLFEVIEVPLPAAGLGAAQLARDLGAAALLIGPGQTFGAAEIDLLPPSVKIVATSSVGFDHMDLAAFRRRAILATNTPDVLTAATADLAFLLLLAAARRLREHLAIVEDGWGKKLGQGEMLGIDVEGKTLGILGMGRIGRALAQRARAFGMKIIYCNRTRLQPELESGARFEADFQRMLAESQFLSLHAPGTAETENIMGAEEFARLPKGAIFVNVARGSLVDEEALFASLSTHHLGAVALDVCRNEPNPDPRFLQFPNLLLSPHMGSATRETREAMGLRALANICSGLAGERPQDLLT